MFAGVKEFFAMRMVLSDTDAVRVGVTAGVQTTVVTGGSVAGMDTVVAAGVAAGGDWEHPQVRRISRAVARSTGTGLIDAGRSFPFNNMLAQLPAPA
jgi:hypothetical protein